MSTPQSDMQPSQQMPDPGDEQLTPDSEVDALEVDAGDFPPLTRAQEEILTKLNEYFLFYAERAVGDLAFDLSQRFLMLEARRIDQHEGKTGKQLRRYCKTQVKFRVMDLAKYAWNTRVDLASEGADQRLKAMTVSTPEDNWEKESIHDDIEEAFRRLPPAQERAIRMWFDDLTYPEMSAQTGKSENTLKHQTQSAFRKLAELLPQYKPKGGRTEE